MLQVLISFRLVSIEKKKILKLSTDTYIAIKCRHLELPPNLTLNVWFVIMS